jgi:hypothetical protein
MERERLAQESLQEPLKILPSNVRISLPLKASQIFINLSQEAETTRMESLANKPQLTICV